MVPLFQTDCSVHLKIVRAFAVQSGYDSVQNLSSRKLHNHARYFYDFLNSNVPQFYGLTACPSIHKYHWFILARLGYVG